MSREVRRVQVDWKHPTEYNEHWAFQYQMRARRGGPDSKMHHVDERFIPLYGTSITEAQAEWDGEQAQWIAGNHESLLFTLRYHSVDGYLNRDGTRDNPITYKVYSDDGNTVVREFFPTSVAEIVEVYPYEDYAGTRPNSETHMPDWDVPEDELGWCLYETVSEGTPVTPVFATAEELVDHLCSVGQDWDQLPFRRESAEALVRQGGSFGSFVAIGGQLFDGSKDLDKIAEATA